MAVWREGKIERVGQKKKSIGERLSIYLKGKRAHTCAHMHAHKLTLTLQLRQNSSGKAGDKTQQFPIAQSLCNGKNCLPHVPY